MDGKKNRHLSGWMKPRESWGKPSANPKQMASIRSMFEKRKFTFERGFTEQLTRSPPHKQKNSLRDSGVPPYQSISCSMGKNAPLPKGPGNKRLSFWDLYEKWAKLGKPQGQRVDSLWATASMRCQVRISIEPPASFSKAGRLRPGRRSKQHMLAQKDDHSCGMPKKTKPFCQSPFRVTHGSWDGF